MRRNQEQAIVNGINVVDMRGFLADDDLHDPNKEANLEVNMEDNCEIVETCSNNDNGSNIETPDVDNITPSLNIIDLLQEREGYLPEFPNGVPVVTERRSQWLKSTPKQYQNYTGGAELDKVLSVKKSTSPKERRRKRMEMKYRN